LRSAVVGCGERPDGRYPRAPPNQPDRSCDIVHPVSRHRFRPTQERHHRGTGSRFCFEAVAPVGAVMVLRPFSLIDRSDSRPEAGGDARGRRDSEVPGCALSPLHRAGLAGHRRSAGLGDRVDLSGDALGEGLGLRQEGVVA
jgi:hypothetical protein